jgi:hypothetical protein
MGFETDPTRHAARAAGRKTYLSPTPCIRGHFERFTNTSRCVRCTAKHPDVALRPKAIIERRSARPGPPPRPLRRRYISAIQDHHCQSIEGLAVSRHLNNLIRAHSGLEAVEVAAAPALATPRKMTRAGWDNAVRTRSGYVKPERTYWNAP